MARSNGLTVTTVGGGGALQTTDVGGSRFPSFASSVFGPISQLASTSATTYATPSVPPVYGASSLGGGYGSGYQAASNIASANPWSATDSPVPWVLGGLVVAILVIWRLYYKGHK